MTFWMYVIYFLKLLNMVWKKKRLENKLIYFLNKLPLNTHLSIYGKTAK